jgi:hypothetical protein
MEVFFYHMGKRTGKIGHHGGKSADIKALGAFPGAGQQAAQQTEVFVFGAGAFGGKAPRTGKTPRCICLLRMGIAHVNDKTARIHRLQTLDRAFVPSRKDWPHGSLLHVNIAISP